MKAILITDGRSVPQTQIYPFINHKTDLEERFHLVFDEVRVSTPGNMSRDLYVGQPDLVFIQDRCLEGLQVRDRVEFLQAVRGKAKVVLLDSHDSTYAGGFKLLPHVDLYVKKSLLKDANLYEHRYLDGRVHADYLIREGNLQADFTGSRIPDRSYWSKIVLGWNIGTAEQLEREFAEQNYRVFPEKHRAIDIQCRIATAKDPRREWYVFHRESAMKRVRQLRDDYTIIATDSATPRSEFLNELGNSKITVSPFGWGEICRRDFEAVICGSLLIKPSMDHLRTLPDIYASGRTYVSVRWDFADLVEKCVCFLEDEKRRQEIVLNAATEYARFFSEGLFLGKVNEILGKLDLR